MAGGAHIPGWTKVAAGALLASSLLAPHAHAGYRIGRDFFGRVPHTLLDFETRGDGSPVNLVEGDAALVPNNEYLSHGITFVGSRGFWANDASDDVEGALAAAGSLQHTLIVFPTSNDPPRLVFLPNVPDVHAVGITVLYNRVSGPAPPVISVRGLRDSQVVVLAEIAFADIIEGSSGVVDYGFLGFTSEETIVSLEFSSTAFVAFDDLRRSNIPAPSTAFAVLFGGALTARRRRRAVAPLATIAGAGCAALAPHAHAGYRIDRDFFGRVPHTLLDFETRGDGSPVNLVEGDAALVPLNEYPGISFIGSRGFWANDASDDVEGALAIAGSLQHTLIVFPTSNDPPRLLFLPNVHAVGITVLYNRVSGPAPPVITVLGERESKLVVLAEIAFADIIEGSSGVVDYGFLGFTSEERIVGLEVSSTAFVAFDDLRLSNIPAPSTALALLYGGAMTVRRRRRR